MIMDNKTEALSKSNQQNDIYNYNLDHVYCSDNSNYRNATINNASVDLKALRKENKQLQAMLLLHLDLIQEQSNQIIAKDKQLLQLREENEQLRARSERRTSKGNSSIAGKTSNSPTIDSYFTVTDASRNRLSDSNQIKTLASRLSDIDRNNEENDIKSSSEKQTNSINFKEQTIIEKNSINKNRFSEASVIGNNNGKLISKIILQRKQSETGEKIFIRTKNVDINKQHKIDTEIGKERITNIIKTEKMEIDKHSNEYESRISRFDDKSNDTKKLTVSINNASQINTENNNEQKRKIENIQAKETRQVRVVLEKIPCTIGSTVNVSNSMTINSNASSIQTNNTTAETTNHATGSMQPFMRRQSTRQNYLSTTKEYMTREWQLDEIQAEVNQLITDEPCKGASECLEIPKWKTWEYSGTREPPPEYEDLSDGAFKRRHERFLLDERKRKKWDVQRIREQRTIERLKRRHCKDEMNQLNQDNEIYSFFPPAENLKVIHLTNEYPVSAFGEVIPAIQPCEFSLPWLRSSSSTNELNNSLTSNLVRSNSVADNPSSVSSIVFLTKRRAWRSKNLNPTSTPWKSST